MDLRIFGRHEERVIAQLRRCVAQEDGARGVLCADGHLGYSAPIGGVVAYRDHVAPAAVGYDIGCGNLAVRTDLTADAAFRSALAGLMDRIFAEVSFGVGRRDGRAADHPVIDSIRKADFKPQRRLARLAAEQLGTVGAGNHYVDVFADEQERVWVGVHFGSRGFGHRTASGFLALAGGHGFEDRVGEGEMESAPDVLHVDSELGSAYLAAMELAGDYARAGREVVVAQVLAILGAQELEAVHNHHNYAWREQHAGEDFFVVRKGATPAFPGQRGFVGATMGEPAVILEGTRAGEEALFSTIHGAGRAMSRTQAAGRSRRRWACGNPACDWVQPPGSAKPRRLCPNCASSTKGFRRRWVRETAGAIDWPATVAELAAKGIELRGANAEEAPGAYKRLDEVLREHGDTVRVVHTLTPLGVAMAPGDTADPYKD
jgi:tRNA-splicing ligase RtcB